MHVAAAIRIKLMSAFNMRCKVKQTTGTLGSSTLKPQAGRCALQGGYSGSYIAQRTRTTTNAPTADAHVYKFSRGDNYAKTEVSPAK